MLTAYGSAPLQKEAVNGKPASTVYQPKKKKPIGDRIVAMAKKKP